LKLFGRQVSGKQITAGLIVATIAGLVGWDIVVASNKEKGDTISEILLRAARKVPAVAMAWGVLSGHLFWPQRMDEDGKR
jgi:hypothetical protein